MASYTYQAVRKITEDGSTTIKYVDKAYTSLGFKNNTLQTDLNEDEWTQIKTDVPLTINSVDSGNCQIIDQEDGTYTCKYVDPNGYARKFTMSVNMILDLSAGVPEVMKSIYFRMVLDRGGVVINLPEFAMIEGFTDGINLSSSSLFELYPDDIIYFEMMNSINSDPVLVKFLSIVVMEL